MNCFLGLTVLRVSAISLQSSLEQLHSNKTNIFNQTIDLDQLNLISERKYYDHSIEIENDVSTETPTHITDEMGNGITNKDLNDETPTHITDEMGNGIANKDLNDENFEIGETYKNIEEPIIQDLNNTYINDFVIKENKSVNQDNSHEAGSETDKFAKTKNNESSKNAMDKKHNYVKTPEIPVKDSDNQIVQTLNDEATQESDAEPENVYDTEIIEKDVITVIPKTSVDEALENYVRQINLNTF